MNALIAQWLPLFFDPDDVFEVRGLDVERPGRKVAGFITAKRIPAMVGAIAALAEKANGVYFTPQCVRRDVVNPKELNHMPEVGSNAKLTRDSDVTARRYFIIDVDPVRPKEHKKDSATDEEKQAALHVANNVRQCLSQAGWSSPLVVDSGNGFHLYYRLKTPLCGGTVDSITDANASLLRVLKRTFDTPHYEPLRAEIDATVFNASRVMKIPGTPSRKGKPTAERPHRTSAVLEVPSDWK